MKKLNLYLNESQYEKLCILAEEEQYETPEEYANEKFYTLLLTKWLKHQSEEIDKIMADPTVNWEE